MFSLGQRWAASHSSSPHRYSLRAPSRRENGPRNSGQPANGQAPRQGRRTSARDRLPGDCIEGPGLARVRLTDSPMLRGSGRTRSEITRTSRTHRAANCARIAHMRPAGSAIRPMASCLYLPAARALQQDFAKHADNPVKEGYIEPLVRCAPAGVPKTFTWHGFEIRQYPGKLFLWFNSGWRLIHLDGSAHLDPSIKLWQGDSADHWEGNTLVVDTTNNNGKALFDRNGNFMSENATAVERFIFQPDGKRFNYVVTVTDPTVYSRPWTATIPVRRYTTAGQAGRLELRGVGCEPPWSSGLG